MSQKRSAKWDEEKLAFAYKLINRERVGTDTPVQILHEALLVMQFGGISAQDMLDYIEANE